MRRGGTDVSCSSDVGFHYSWPGVVVVADVETGEILFRVRSATLAYGDWLGGSRWLPSGDGLVMEVKDGYVIARVRPVQELVYRPGAPSGWYGWSGPAPLPAPVGDDRFFSYGRLGLYDAHEDRWSIARLPEAYVYTEATPDHHAPWGTTDREMRFRLGHGGHGGGVCIFAGYPRIEFPPFNDESVLRVARTGSCLYLRAESGKEGGILDCLPEGTRLVPRISAEWAEALGYDGRHDEWPDGFGFSGPSLEWACVGSGECSAYDSYGYWVYVRTDDGAEGWVAHEYLEWY